MKSHKTLMVAGSAAAVALSLWIGGRRYKRKRMYHATPEEFEAHKSKLGGFKETLSEKGEYPIEADGRIDHVWYYFEKVSFSFREPVYLETDGASILVPKEGDLVYLQCSHTLSNSSGKSLIHRGKVYK